MNVLMQAPQTESKDIKLIDKKVLDTKSTDDKDFFENIISNIISDVEEGENKNFLLAKLLNLSSEFEKKEETISDFSQGTLFTDHQIEQISIQDLLKVAMLIKNNEDVATFPTDSQSLKLALTKPDVTEQFKDAKNIKDLLDIAKKNNIEVKNFQFFSESAALNPSDKKMVQQLKSEDIFKLIEKQIETKTEKTLHQLTHTNQVTQKSNQKVNILQTVLASKEVSKPLQKDQATSNTKSLPVTEEKIDVQTTIVKKVVVQNR
ncbi:MAG: hypothetical protein K0U47_08510, partial [Epsilonproteobacteria bacterium]|nr:hypothetical protein [Campylobacterota bacterium]